MSSENPRIFYWKIQFQRSHYRPCPVNPEFRQALRTFLLFARTRAHCAALSQNEKRAANKRVAHYLRGARRIPVARTRVGNRREPAAFPVSPLPFFARGKRNGGRSDRCGNNRTIRKFGRIRLGANSRPPIPPDRKTHRRFQSPRHKNPYPYFRLLHFRGRKKVARAHKFNPSPD